MKVIFLDIDGVMVTGETVNQRQAVGDYHFCAFAKSSVFQLNRITEATDASIVVSSSWRCDGPRWDALLEHFHNQGVERTPIGRTPFLEKFVNGVWHGAQRGAEIQAWVGGMSDVESFVAIDDDSDMDAIPNNFVHVPNGMWRGGLLRPHADLAIAILGRKP